MYNEVFFFVLNFRVGGSLSAQDVKLYDLYKQAP